VKVLLDENFPHSLREQPSSARDVHCRLNGWAGLKNGELLDVADAGGFDVLATGDRTLHHEQNLSGRKIAPVSLSAVSWPVIEPHVSKIADAVASAKPGSFTRVDVGKFKKAEGGGDVKQLRTNKRSKFIKIQDGGEGGIRTPGRL
jgi:hypothetical protein